MTWKWKYGHVELYFLSFLEVWIWTFHLIPILSTQSTRKKTIYLLWSVGLYKVRINLLGFWGDLSGGFGFLEILAGQPELHILLTELWLQKCPKSCQTIWGKMHKMMGRGKLMPFICMYIHTCVCMCVHIDIYVVYRV